MGDKNKLNKGRGWVCFSRILSWIDGYYEMIVISKKWDGSSLSIFNTLFMDNGR